MTSRQRIASAQNSGNLAERPDGIGDIDVVRACGAVAVSMPLGVSLWRLKYGGDGRELAAVFEGLADKARRKGFEGDVAALVARVVRHWIDDVCHPCKGRGYELIAGTPMLSDVACGSCKGKGRTELQDADEAARWLQDTIASLERQVAAAIMRKLSDEIDLML
jgi:hypothetical protein